METICSKCGGEGWIYQLDGKVRRCDCPPDKQVPKQPPSQQEPAESGEVTANDVHAFLNGFIPATFASNRDTATEIMRQHIEPLQRELKDLKYIKQQRDGIFNQLSSKDKTIARLEAEVEELKKTKA